MIVTFRSLVPLAALAAATAQAQSSPDVRFGSSPNPVGSGARALGQASAFIATADDATAASWNPAGLIALEGPEVSLVVDTSQRREGFEGMGIAEDDRVQSSLGGGLNYFSLAYPFKVGSRYFVAALNFQSLIDFDTEQRGTIRFAQAGNLATMDYALEQTGRLHALTPALAFQLTPRLSLGLAVSFWTHRLGYQNGWTDEAHVTTLLTASNGTSFTSVTESVEHFSFSGGGANLGLMWDVSPRFTIGAVVKTPTWGTARRDIASWRSQAFAADGTPLGEPSTVSRQVDEPMRWPLSYGAGVAYRRSDELTVSADVYRTEWGTFRRRNTDPVSGQTEAINPISGERYADAEVSGITQAHLGVEYLFIFERTVLPVRGGLLFDQEPRHGHNNAFYGAAFGTGVSLGDVVLDAAYQVRFGPSANPSVVSAPAGGEGTYLMSEQGSVLQHQLYVSAIYYLPVMD